jgi:hypothetical protein
MQQSFTAVLERNARLTGEFVTEPYEAPWAIEGRWFVQVLEADADTAVRVVTEVSPDGLNWIEIDETEREHRGTGLLTWSVREFGAWLRIRGVVEGDRTAKARIYLMLKG